MEERHSTSINWFSTASRGIFCPFGSWGDGTVAGNTRCRTFLEWLQMLFGGGSSDEEETKDDQLNSGDDDGGGSGGTDPGNGDNNGDFDWGPPPPPPPPPSGGDGGGGPCSSCPVYQPPNDDGPTHGPAEVVTDLINPNPLQLELLNNSSRTDTVKPVKVNCPDSDNNLAKYLDTLMTYVDTSAMMKKLRDSASTRVKEAGFSIRTIGTNPPFAYRPEQWSEGENYSVSLYMDDYTVANYHLHTAKTADGNSPIPSPSPRDCWSLIKNAAEPKKRQFSAMFTLYGGDSKDEFAIVITDPASPSNFYTSNNITQFIDTMPIKDGKHNNQLNNWAGDASNEKTLYGMFLSVFTSLKNQNYPVEFLDTYANLIVMAKAGFPIQLSRRASDGKYKIMRFIEEGSGDKLKYTITICN